MSNPRTFTRLAGQELAALRRATGTTQVQLARAAGIGWQAVSYWERRPSVAPYGWAPKRIFEVLGIRIVPHIETVTRTGARTHDGVLLPRPLSPTKDVIRRPLGSGPVTALVFQRLS